jgi:hypothetical protein
VSDDDSRRIDGIAAFVICSKTLEGRQQFGREDDHD